MFVDYIVGDRDSFWFDLRVKQLIAEDGRDAIAVEVQRECLLQEGGRGWETCGVKVAT